MKIADALDKSAAFCARMTRPAPIWLVALSGAAILLGAHLVGSWLRDRSAEGERDWRFLAEQRDRAVAATADLQTLRDFKSRDVSRLKASMAGLTRSKRDFFETGLALQEEKRLLEKQWAIMTTYLLIDIPEKKIRLMRGDQALESFSVSYASAAFGGLDKALPYSVQIVSKERFAHPERGVSEQIGGKLQWVPPQVGTSLRSNALGEFVIFFNGNFVLHGPAKNVFDHAAFPHHCTGLSLGAAKKLYKETFIGSRLIFKKR
jgi:hypothetical protein